MLLRVGYKGWDFVAAVVANPPALHEFTFSLGSTPTQMGGFTTQV